jgi:hypothetical protein
MMLTTMLRTLSTCGSIEMFNRADGSLLGLFDAGSGTHLSGDQT